MVLFISNDLIGAFSLVIFKRKIGENRLENKVDKYHKIIRALSVDLEKQTAQNSLEVLGSLSDKHFLIKIVLKATHFWL